MEISLFHVKPLLARGKKMSHIIDDSVTDRAVLKIHIATYYKKKNRLKLENTSV